MIDFIAAIYYLYNKLFTPCINISVFILSLIVFGGNKCLDGKNIYFLGDPVEAKGCSTNSLVIDSVNQSVILFLPQIYGAAMPKRLEIALPVIK